MPQKKYYSSPFLKFKFKEKHVDIQIDMFYAEFNKYFNYLGDRVNSYIYILYACIIE